MTGGTTPEDRLGELGWGLPAVPQPKGLYRPALLDGSILHLSAHGPFSAGEAGTFTHHGVIGDDLTIEEAVAAAHAVGLALLASTKSVLGSLGGVKQALALTGYLNAAPDVVDHANVLDGTSRVLIDVLGHAGRHTRTVVGVATLPFNLPLVASLTLRCVSPPTQRTQR